MNEVEALLFRVAIGDSDGLDQLEPEDWPRFCRLAFEGGIDGLVYFRCVEAGIELPLAIKKSLEQGYRQIAVDNLRAWLRLKQILQDLALRNLSLVIMPGAALMPLYPDLGCRAMDDIDVLMQEKQTTDIKDCLVQSGLTRVKRHDELYQDDNLLVDLHEELLNVKRVKARRFIGDMDPEAVWNSKCRQVIEGGQVETMDSEDMLIFTAFHGLKHTYKRITWLIDLFLLAQIVDWQVVASRVKQYKLKRPLAYGLILLEYKLGAELPAEGRAWCAGLRLGKLEQKLIYRAFEDRQYAAWGDLLFAFSVQGFVKRIIFLAETYFPRPYVLLQVFPRVPKVLFLLTYGLRVFQILIVGIRHMTRLIRRSKD